jgi:hypothetical protein
LGLASSFLKTKGSDKVLVMHTEGSSPLVLVVENGVGE